jgi:predicted PurR-regulated permease PerM
MRKKQKGLSLILLITAVIAVIVVAGIIFLKKQSNTELNQQIPQGSQSSIQNSNDLNAASTDLDNTDIDSLDNELNQVNSDASTF